MFEPTALLRSTIANKLDEIAKDCKDTREALYSSSTFSITTLENWLEEIAKKAVSLCEADFR